MAYCCCCCDIVALCLGESGASPATDARIRFSIAIWLIDGAVFVIYLDWGLYWGGLCHMGYLHLPNLLEIFYRYDRFYLSTYGLSTTSSRDTWVVCVYGANLPTCRVNCRTRADAWQLTSNTLALCMQREKKSEYTVCQFSCRVSILHIS